MFGLTVICSDKETWFILFQWKLVIWCNVRDRDSWWCDKAEVSSAITAVGRTEKLMWSITWYTWIQARLLANNSTEHFYKVAAFVDRSSLLRAVLCYFECLTHYCMNEIQLSFCLSLSLFLSHVPYHTEWLMRRCVRGIWLMSSIFLHIVR